MNNEILSKALKKVKKTQKEMAQDLGIRNSRISDMKVGRLQGWKYRRRISQYLGISEDVLFQEDNHQKSCQG